MLQLVSCCDIRRPTPASSPLAFSRRETHPVHPGAKALLRHWRACMAVKGGVVIGRDIPSREIAHLARNILIGERSEGEPDMRCVLAGAAVRPAHGPMRILRLSALFAPTEAWHCVDTAFGVLRTGEPATIRSGVSARGVDTLCTEHLLFPATPCNGKANRLVVGAFYFS